MFDRLSGDINLIILQDFLTHDLLSLSHLDIALTNRHQRPLFLSVMATLKLKMKISSSIPGVSVEFMKWLSVRRISVRELQVDTRGIGQEFRVLPTVEAVVLRDVPEHKDGQLGLLSSTSSLSFSSLNRFPQSCIEGSDRPDLVAFLGHFPALRKLQTCESTTDDQVVNLCNSKCPLEAIDLRCSPNLSSIAVANLVTLMYDRLTEFWSHFADDFVLCEMAARCRSIRCLGLACDRVEQASSVEALCAANAGSLEELHLRYLDDSSTVQPNSILTDELIETIAQSCPNLTTVVIGSKFKYNEVTRVGLQSLVTHCPKLRQVGDRLKDLHLDFFWEEGQRVCSAQCWYDPCASVLLQLLPTLAVPVVKVTVVNVSALINPLLQRLGDVCGSRLKRFECAYLASIENEALRAFLQRCAYLEHVDLSTSMSALCNASLSQLSEYCPRLKTLRLHCVAVTDMTVVMLLAGLRDSTHLHTVILHGCANLTDTVLLKIALLFPCLQLLCVLECNGIRKQTLCDLLLSGKLRPRRIVSNDAEWIMRQVRIAGVKTETKLCSKLSELPEGST